MEAQDRRPLTVAAAQPHARRMTSPPTPSRTPRWSAQAEARVVAFPELSLTGYELDAVPVDPADERLTPLIEACAATGSVALAGAPTADADGEHVGRLARATLTAAPVSARGGV